MKAEVLLLVCLFVFSGPATDDKHGVQFQQIIDWLKEYLRHTFTPLVKAAQEDLNWRVCRMMTKDGRRFQRFPKLFSPMPGNNLNETPPPGETQIQIV